VEAAALARTARGSRRLPLSPPAHFVRPATAAAISYPTGTLQRTCSAR